MLPPWTTSLWYFAKNKVFKDHNNFFLQDTAVNNSYSTWNNPVAPRNAGVDLPLPLPPTDDKETLLHGKHEMLKRADEFANNVSYLK